MLFTDTIFLICLALYLPIYAAADIFSIRLRNFLTISFSLFILASFGIGDLVLFCISAVFNCALLRPLSSSDKRLRRWALILTVTANLAYLAVFKYEHFILSQFPGFSVPARDPESIPLAISFYTFHTISVAVDLYRQRLSRPTFLIYVSYLSFFPHLIAGPIVRGWELFPQLKTELRRKIDFAGGIYLVILGAFLKLVAADSIGAITDAYWDGSKLASASTVDLWAVAFLYYCQIYGDFAGYSLIAIGMARALGVWLPQNFASPMMAGSIRDFWRRWHITLSRWLRDYLYIPVGGSLHGLGDTVRNLMITMCLGGLWHGADWKFVVWGAMHGSALAAEHVFSTHRWFGFFRVNRLVGVLVAQIWVTLAWVFFRSPDIDYAGSFLNAMFRFKGWESFLLSPYLLIAIPFASLVVAHNVFRNTLETNYMRRAIPAGLISGALLMVIIWFPLQERVFIYFKF